MGEGKLEVEVLHKEGRVGGLEEEDGTLINVESLW